MNKRQCIATFLGLSLFGMSSFSQQAIGQVSNLDEATLIEGLRKEGMGDLLKHLVVKLQANPRLDPSILKQVLINQHLLDYAVKKNRSDLTADPVAKAALLAEARADFESALKERRALIEEFKDNYMRPVWQTDLADQLLYEHLQAIYDNAAEFYELGVPTADQAKAFESDAVEMLEQLSDARLNFIRLIGDLPRRPDHVQRRINTGQWDRFTKEYDELRTPYFLANAAYYVTLLPDTHPYYRNLGKNAWVREQARTITEERSRLLTLAIDSLEKFIKVSNDQYEPIRLNAMSITGRTLLQQNRVNDAADMLGKVVNEGGTDLVNLASRIARANALERAGQDDMAMAELTAAGESGQVKQNLLYRLLVVDAKHRLLRDRAMALPKEQRVAGLAAAYEPYQQIISDPELGTLQQAVRTYIYRRWESSIPATRDLKDEPSIVVVAIGEMSMQAGRGMLDEAEGLAEGGDAAASEALVTQARTKLDRSIKVNSELLKRAALDNPTKAQAMYNLAVARFFLYRDDDAQQLQTASILVDLGDQLPDQPLGAAGIGDALNLLTPMRFPGGENKPSPGVPELYERAMTVVLEKYPNTEAADNQRYNYAAAVLIPDGQLEKADKVLRGLHAQHVDYFLAQRALLELGSRRFRLAKEGERTTLGKQLISDAARIRGEAEQTIGVSNNPDQVSSARQAAGWARLVQADMAVEMDNDIAKGLKFLNGFDQDFSEEPDLIREMLGKRIVLLFQVDQLKLATEEAKRMMEGFPGEAASVIDSVLTKVDEQVTMLNLQADAELAASRKEALQKQAREKAGAAADLAKLLRDWAMAPEQHKSPEELLPFDFIYARALLNNGDVASTLQVVEPLYAKYPRDGELISILAEARFRKAKAELSTNKVAAEQTLIKDVAPLYNTLISGVRPDNTGKYPQVYWNAWVRRLQISDLVQQGVEDIPLRIRQLESTDKNLGGEATRTELRRLLGKYSR